MKITEKIKNTIDKIWGWMMGILAILIYLLFNPFALIFLVAFLGIGVVVIKDWVLPLDENAVIVEFIKSHPEESMSAEIIRSTNHFITLGNPVDFIIETKKNIYTFSCKGRNGSVSCEKLSATPKEE